MEEQTGGRQVTEQSAADASAPGSAGSAPPAPPAPPGPPAGRRGGQPGRYERSFSGLIGAMVLLLVVVGAFVLFRDGNRTSPSNPVEPVEWRPAASYARQEADFRLLAPRRLPAGWYATSVRFDRTEGESWHLGILTDEGRYVGLEQTPDSPGTAVEEFVDEEAEQDGEVEIEGQTWQAWYDDEDRALLLEGRDVTTLVVGTVSQDVLEDFVRSLR